METMTMQSLIEFEAKVEITATLLDLDALREQLGVDRVNLAILETGPVLGFSVPLPESAVEEVDLVARIEEILSVAGCADVAHLSLRKR